MGTGNHNMTKTGPLADWRESTLWFKTKDGVLMEVDVWQPPDITERERVALLAKYASQGVNIIRQLTGEKGLIVQGQYKDEEEASCRP